LSGDPGWQFCRPGEVGPVIAGSGANGFFCVADDEGIGELVEHAVSSMRSRKEQSAHLLKKEFLSITIADSFFAMYKK
jgi:hypothetical protein